MLTQIPNSNSIDEENDSLDPNPNSIDDGNNPISVEDEELKFEEEDVVEIPTVDLIDTQKSQEDVVEIPSVELTDSHKSADEKGGNSEKEEEKQVEEEPESLNLFPPADEGLVLDSELSSPTEEEGRKDPKRKKPLNPKERALEKRLKRVRSSIYVKEEEDGEDFMENGEDDSEVQEIGVTEEEKLQPLLGEEGKEEFDQKKEEEDAEENPEELEGEEEKTTEQEEHEGMNLSGLQFPSADDNQPATVSRKPHKRKKEKKVSKKQQEAIEKKMNILKKNLQPIPFVPEKNLDFSQHEELFKRLGLWDFANIEFDKVIRSDLLTLLIANYNPHSRCSIVDGCRIKLSRADLARALKLPVKKEKNISLETWEFDKETLSEESISFIDEFLSNWILLHEDTCILPKEIVDSNTLIRQGLPHKVDWPKLIWLMVEKEIKQAPEVGTFYYASHIQYLMKSQWSDLFKEELMPEISVDEEEEAVYLKMGSSEDYLGQELGKQQIELCLGQTKNEIEQETREHDAMDYQECKQEPEGQAEWFLDQKKLTSDHFLGRCNLNDAQNLGSQDLMKEDEDEGYDPQSKCDTVGVSDPTDLIGKTNITYGSSFRLSGHTSDDFFQSGLDTHLNPGSTSIFGNAYETELGHDEIAGHHTINDHHKGMRNDPSSLDIISFHDQMQVLLNRSRAMCLEKEKAYQNVRMNEELLISQLQQQNDLLVNTVNKTRYELQIKDRENYKLEHELLLMSNLLEGYRTALKENRRMFAEYRERNPEPVEPLYKDVGPGGIVLSTMEIEKRRLEREEEERLQRYMIEQMIDEFQRGWYAKFDRFENDVSHLDSRLMQLKEKVELFKDTFVKRKNAENVVNEV